MKKIINDPLKVVEESLQGLLYANGDLYEKVPDAGGIISKERNGKTAIVSGGGSGHEPMLSGLVGKGMLTGAAVGNVFASPDPYTIKETIKAADQGKGVLCLIWNYAGDTMNFDVAEDLASMEGVKVSHVIVNDDIASAPKEDKKGRRGVAGILFVAKAAGAAAELGYSLEEVKEAAERANEHVRTIGIAITPCSIPGNPPNFELGEEEYEYGMGIHGEPGISRESLVSADELTEKMIGDLKEEFGDLKGREAVLLVNGMAATTDLELYIINKKACELLKEAGVILYDNIVGKYCTSLEMAGASVSLFILDEELKRLYDQPACTRCYTQKYGKDG